jgi:hypothetical protein
MTHRRALCVSAILLIGSAIALAQNAAPVPIFVTVQETPVLPPLKPEQHEQVIQARRAQMFDTGTQLRKQHGDNTKAWPPEVWNTFHEAEDAYRLAIAHRDYQPSTMRVFLPDSMKDFLRDAEKAKNLQIVQSADEAALIVTITARRMGSASGITDNRYFVRFTLRPGPKLSGERFVEANRDYKWNPLIATQLVHVKDPAGYVELEAGSMAGFRQAGGAVNTLVLVFSRERLQAPVKK